MLRNPSTLPKTSRLAVAVVVGIAALAMVPLQLIARAPAAGPLILQAVPQQPAPIEHSIAAVDVPAPPVAAAEPRFAGQAGDPQHERDLTYVLFLEDGQRNVMMSGSTGDVDHARRLRRNSERLLWFRHGGKEYVVRDAALLQQVEEIWLPVNELGRQLGQLGSRQGELGSKQGELGAKQGEVGAKQGILGAKQGKLGARQGVLGSRQASRLSEAERSKIDAEMRAIDEQMRELGRQMDALDTKMKEFDRPMRELGDRMDVLGNEMDILGRRMDEASAKAESAMRALLERTVGIGVAQEVK